MAHIAWRVLACSAALAAFLTASGASAADAGAVSVSASAVVDAWSNFRGGLRTGSAQLAEIEGRLDVDAERLVGWRGGALSMSALETAFGGPSTKVVGDIQAIDNKEATPGARLYEAWLSQRFARGYVKAGIIDLNSEFNVSSVSGLFLNGAQGLGLELGQVGANGPSVYPAPRVGLVGASDGPDGLRVGVFDGIAELGGPRRGEGPFVVHGLLTIAEATGPIPGGGRISLGVWRHEAGYGSTLDPIRTAAATGAYLLADGPIWEGGSRALRGLVRIGLADPKTEQIATHLTADLVLDKPFSGADGEALGLGVVSARNGAHAVRRGELQGPPLAKAETAIELSYRCPVSANVFLQPDLQYVVHPGGVAGRGDALVAGIRVGFSWSAGRR